MNLAGLFPINDEQVWNENIRWNPLPVHTIPTKYDFALYGPDDCPKFFAAYEKYQKESPEVQRIYREYADELLLWSERSGSNITTIDDVAQLYTTLYIEKLYNKPLVLESFIHNFHHL